MPTDPPTELRHCGSCRDERPFESPPCQDGHGGDCPERVCVDCGAALLVDPCPTGVERATGTGPLPHTTHAA